MTDKLLPCPFCGSEQVFAFERLRTYCVCMGCCSEGPAGPTRADGIELWNKRAPAPGLTPPAPVIEAGDLVEVVDATDSRLSVGDRFYVSGSYGAVNMVSIEGDLYDPARFRIIQKRRVEKDSQPAVDKEH